MTQSALHFELTRWVDAWLNARQTGAGHYSATEVWLAGGYVADAVAIASLQHRFWLEATGSSLSEWRVVGDRLVVPERLVMVFETKVSRSDFLSTFSPTRTGNRLSPIGNLHYLITADGLDCSCLPEWWGILKQSGRGLKQVRHAQFCEIEESQLHHAAYRVLLASHRNPIVEL